ncbi:MAG: hypothetical protein ACLQVX_23725 [Limisphaerales bacterium]
MRYGLTVLWRRGGDNDALLPWSFETYSGLTNPPAGLSNVVAIAAGLAHGMALRADGTVAVWGDNSVGQTNTPFALNNVVAIAAGDAHCLALRADGTVDGWGMWAAPPAPDTSYWPVTVPAGLSNVVAIASGDNQAMALKADGTVTIWGAAGGDSASNAVAMAGGDGFNMMLRADGTPEELGQPYGTPVPPGLSNVVALACGYWHALALIGTGPPVAGLRMAARQTAGGAGTAVFYAPGVGGWPLGYQWQLNGTNLPGANSPWLVVTGGLPAQAGLYSVVLSNAVGLAASPGVSLEVAPAIFNGPPQDKVVCLGGTARFDVQVQTDEPLSYQWQLNGNDLSGQTDAALVLPDVDWPQAGAYSLLVSNSLGTALSRTAVLRIINVAGWGGMEMPGFPGPRFSRARPRRWRA